MQHHVSHIAMEDYFKLSKRFPNSFYRGSFTSAHTLFKTIDKMTYDLGWSSSKSERVCQCLPEDLKETGEDEMDPWDDTYATFFYRNPLSCIEFLMRQQRLADDFIYEPYKDFNEKGERLYGDMCTTNWWWETQVRTQFDLYRPQTDDLSIRSHRAVRSFL